MNQTISNIPLELLYGQFIDEKVMLGFSPVLLTFMFRPLASEPRARNAQMVYEVERVYASLLTYQVRETNIPAEELPMWIYVPDFPVPKYDKFPLATVIINEGLHGHAIGLVPPITRLRWPLERLIELKQAMLTREPHLLYRLDARPITHNLHGVVDYVFKSVKRGRVPESDILILPRTKSEMPKR